MLKFYLNYEHFFKSAMQKCKNLAFWNLSALLFLESCWSKTACEKKQEDILIILNPVLQDRQCCFIHHERNNFWIQSIKVLFLKKFN